jgi:hypothetical protein
MMRSGPEQYRHITCSITLRRSIRDIFICPYFLLLIHLVFRGLKVPYHAFGVGPCTARTPLFKIDSGYPNRTLHAVIDSEIPLTMALTKSTFMHFNHAPDNINRIFTCIAGSKAE